ncbi:uncharacterized protein [Bemisia tabaci]
MSNSDSSLFAAQNVIAHSVEKGSVELTKKLIEVNSNINALTPDEKTPLFIAAEDGNVALVKLLLEQPNLDVNRLHHGKTPLHIACEKGHTDIVKVLLADNRCSHYINTYFNGKAPIHIASQYGQTEILSNLLEEEPDVNAVDDNGCTSLWIAIENNQEKCVQILLKDERVDVKTRHFNQTPLERALKEKNTNISKLIIDRVGDIEITDEGGLNPLHRAVDEGMLDVVDYIIKKGANIQCKTKNGNTPLHIAAKHGHTEIAELLVKNGADIHARSENYHNATPLQYAIKCENLEVAKFLISVGSDVNAYDPRAHYARDRGGTLLHYAARDTDDKLIRFLVENGADVNATENDGRTPLCLLAKHDGSFDTMRYLIEKGATLNNARGGTPLYWAMYADFGGHDSKAADFLIGMGTDVNSCIDYHGDERDQMRTALHLARHLSTVKLLIDKGANVNAKDKLLNTPLHSAKTPSIARCLIQHGAEVNASNESGDTPLHFVQNFHVAKVLIEKGANVNASNNEGYTPLHTARNTAVAKLLLENGAELKAVTKDGKTVLHTAAEADVIMSSRFKGVAGVAEFFVQNGIDVDSVDNFGNTPLHLCGISSNLQVATVLLDNGAKINVHNKSNKRPIEMNRYPDSVNSFLSRKLSAVDQIFTAIIDNEGIEKVKCLLKTAEVINLKQENSQLTLLHHAVKQNNKKILRFLLQEKITPRSPYLTFPGLFNRGKGAPRSGDPHISRILEKINVNPCCKNNWTPLHYAAKGDDPESVTLLLQCGAAYEAKTNEGKTPFDLAECNSIREILTMVGELFEAVKKGKKDLVSELLKKNYGIVNAVDSNGCSPLYFAVSNDFKDITSLLLENGANVAQVTNSGSTLFHLAAAKGDAELADTIFKHAKKNGSSNVFVNAKEENGTTALHIAAQNGSVEMTKALLKHGAMYNARNKENKKPSDLSRKEDVTSILNLVEESFKAVEENAEELLNRLREMEFDEFFSVTNAQDNYGQTLPDFIAGSEFSKIKTSKDRELLLQTNPCRHSQTPVFFTRRFIIMSISDSPLFAAVESNDISSLSTIMQNKIVNVSELHSCGKTSLHIAVEKGSIELTKKLIEVNSNINALTPDEKTPLFIAAEDGNVALVKQLLKQPNLDVNMLHHGKTPLHIACEKGHTDIVKVLLADNRCSHYINTYFNGKAPIHIASQYGQTEILSNLLEEEPDVNAVDDNGCTSLWIAIENNQEECVQILLKDERVDVKTRHFNQTPLERALKEKNTNISKLIIDRVGDIEITDEGGLNPLHRAVDEGRLDVVDYLIKKGADIQCKTKNGKTPLHIAAIHGHTEIAELLVENGADIHARSENYHYATPLQYAIECKKLEVAKILISVGSDVNAYDPLVHFARGRGGTLLHYAARDTDDTLIRFLVENGADVNATEYDGRTPLCLLVKHHGSFAVMRYLIEKGATLNNERGGTPLYWAMREGYGGYDLKAANFLIEMGTDVNSYIDYHGDEWDQMRTALHLARHLSTVQLLIDKGANVNAKDKLVNTPLHSAKTPSIAKCLIQHGAEVNASNELGDTPLHFEQNFLVAKVLIEKGANVNASNNEGYTPLHTARNTAVAKLLLENGAELKAVTKDGKTVLHTAAEADVIMSSRFKGVGGVAEFFLQNGIDIDTIDNYGNTPLHLCGISSNLEVATVLLDNAAKLNVRNKLSMTPKEMNLYPGSVNSFLTRKLRAVDQIFTAIIDNQGIIEIKDLIKTAEVINQKQKDSQLTLLHHAVKQNNKKILRFLLQEKITPRSTNLPFPGLFNRGKGAPRSGDPHISRILEKINVNPCCKNNWTPLHYAAKGDDPETVTLLLQCGAAYEAKTNEGKIPLDLAECNSIKEILTLANEFFEAVKEGKKDLVSELLKNNYGILNAVDSNGCSPLYFSVSNDFKDITSLLLENGANVAQVTNSGSTLLHLAAAKGDAELADTIFKHAKKNGSSNVFVNARGENGSTALHIAAQNGSVEMTKALLKHGAMYNARNKENKKPSDLSRKEDVTSILILVEELFKAVEENAEELLNRLREMEFDEFFAVTNAQDYYGQTLLDYIGNNAHSFAGSEFSKIKKAKDRELSLQTNPCYYSQTPVYSQELLDNIDLGFGLFDG